MKLDIVNDYLVDISVIVGAVHYICDLQMFSFAPVTEADAMKES